MEVLCINGTKKIGRKDTRQQILLTMDKEHFTRLDSGGFQRVVPNTNENR